MYDHFCFSISLPVFIILHFKNYTHHQERETGIEMQNANNWKEHPNSTSHSQGNKLNPTQILQRYFVDWLKSIFYRDSITSNLKKQSHYQEEIEMNNIIIG